MKKRHWGVLFSFFALVFAPFLVAVWYLYFVSVDQYASTVGFTVRKEESGSATDLLGGIAQFAGAGGSGDADALYEFIQSQEMVEKVDASLDLVGHYSAYWGEDPVFSLWPDATIEDLLWFWGRNVRVSYDQGTGLVNLQVRAFEADMAQAIGNEIVGVSQERVNELNEAARGDLMRYAQVDLEDSIARLKATREALTQFRVRTRIVDPEADIQGRMGVFNNLQQQLAEALVEYDILRTTAVETDPRLVQELQRIQVIQERIRQERETFASGKVVGGDADYPTLLAEFESLTVDREFAEETYRAALAALDIARANATRQSRYLATYIRPTLAQSAEYPQREILLGLSALFMLMAWSIMVLVFYSLRDRR
ncbi:sugar transporter [Shimia sp.]|uniref:sugar transporter n=1 Tax=Shimia sp. TaxID=1954381 RepID=UPI0032968BA1